MAHSNAAAATTLRTQLAKSLRYDLASTLVRTAFQETRTPDQSPTPIRELDHLVGGFPRGAVTELIGPPSSGRTSFVQSSLARLTASGECCAYLDASDTFDPCAAAQAGVVLSHVLWARCGGDSMKLWKAADLLLQGGGFGVVVLDLGDMPAREMNRLSVSTWYRFRQAVEKTPTILLVIAPQSVAKSCTSLLLAFTPERVSWTGSLSPHRLLDRLCFKIAPRKPQRPHPVLAWAAGWE